MRMRRRLRVAQIVTTLARGGAQATALAALDSADPDIEVVLLAGADDTGESSFWDDCVGDSRVVPVPELHRSMRPDAEHRALAAVTAALRALRPDVVHTHSSKAGVLGRVAANRLGVPVAHTVHGWSMAGPTSSRSMLVRARRRGVVALEQALAARTDAIVVVTEADRSAGLAAGIGQPDQYHVIRSGIDLSVPTRAADDPHAQRAQLGVGPGFLVGTVARLSPQKDLGTLLTGFARARRDLERIAPDGPPSLVIIGGGPDHDALRTRTSALGLDEYVRFLGPRADAAALVAGFDLFALSSRWEGLPRSIVEAVAAGVPVVATDVGGVSELIDHGRTGRLVAAGDADAIANALVDAAAASGQSVAMARRARHDIDAFAVDRMRTDLAELWRSLAGAEVIPIGAAVAARSGPRPPHAS
ncbi:MAG: glycosyltransferase [Actinomycetota bacterium]